MWKPNLLNFPSYASARLARGMLDIIAKRNEQGQLPPKFQKYVNITAKSIPTIRSIVMARPGYCIVEADYKTAEMRGLAYISGDHNLIDLIEKDDPYFAKVKPEYVPPGVDPEECACRLFFPEYISNPPDKDKYLMTYAVNGEIKGRFTEDMLQRNEDGTYKGPSRDLHWGVVERAQKTAREVLDKKRDRGAGKVSNFSSSYGASPTSIERKIEADIGTEPEEGTGQALLDAIEARQPIATQFFKKMELVPRDKGFLRAASGRIRHCHVFANDINGLSVRDQEGVITALGRECRNFFMQESVGACAARACAWLTTFKYNTGLEGSLIVCLYDSCVIHCPEEERMIWKKAILLYMYLTNGYEYEGKILRYPVDLEFNAGWSTKPDKEWLAKLQNPDYKPTPEKYRMLENWLDSEIEKCENNPQLSLHGQYPVEM